MAIIFDENNRLITLNTKNSTYQMKIDEYGFLLHLYYGKRTNGNMDYILVNLDRGFSGNPYDAGDNRKYSLDALLQEFPCRGAGDFRSPVFEVRYEDGSFGCDLRYESHIIKDGKYGLSGLPAVYENSDMDKAQTLEITLSDKVSGIKVILYYGIIESLDIITRAANVINENKNNIYIEKLQSACLDFVSGNFDLITFYGRHAMERNIQRQSVGHGSYRIGSRRGTSSHQYNPLMILADSDANEDYGNCYAMSFVYSGGFLGEAEKDQYGQTRMQLGLMEEQFSYCLKSGESIIAPEVIMSYSDRGLAVLSQNLHKCIRENVCRGKYKNEVRPVLVNSWEASYFDIDKNSIVNLAKNAAELGVEMLVMDDGWFGKRDDDNSGLGDWFTNENKIGCSLKELVEAVNNCGIKFGIWVEPEMVNEDSDLYRKHPDWAFAVPGKKPVRSRNQLVLDFSRKEVVDYIYDSITKVIESGNIEYIKWDMNRSIANVYSNEDKYQGNVYYDYVFDGIYQEGDELPAGYASGYARFKDLNDDGKVEAEHDRTIIGQGSQPKYRWGITNNFSYKNFDLSIFINAMQGWIGTFNDLDFYNNSLDPVRPVNMYDGGWWTPENKSNSRPSLEYRRSVLGHNWYSDRSFIRVQEVSLSYRFPQKFLTKYRLSNLSVFLSGKNLLTFTDWLGTNPESISSERYPIARTYTLGFKLGF